MQTLKIASKKHRLLMLLLLTFTLSSCSTPGAKKRDQRRGLASKKEVVENAAAYEGAFTMMGSQHKEMGQEKATQGVWLFLPEALKKKYNNLPAERFGTVALRLFNGEYVPSRSHPNRSKVVRDLHYPLKILSGETEKRYGMRLLPIVDRKGVVYKEPQIYFDYPPKETYYQQNPYYKITVEGSESIDRVLRESYGFNADDQTAPIFALTGFVMPEHHDLELLEEGVDPESGKIENGVGHLGAYIGKGNVRNAPSNYHEYKWDVRGYPANIYTVAVDKKVASAKNFNTNFIVTLRLLNELNDGPTFPDEYEKDYFRTFNLKETLDFYRGWIDPTWVRPEDIKAGRKDKEGNYIPYLKYLQEYESTFQTYCAEHMTIVLNVALNVPHTEEWYRKIWPDRNGEDGADFFAKVVERWKEIPNKIPIKKDTFVELWGEKKGPAEFEKYSQIWPDFPSYISRKESWYQSLFGPEKGEKIYASLDQGKKDLNLGPLPTLKKDFKMTPLWALGKNVVSSFIKKFQKQNPSQIEKVGKHLAWKPMTTYDFVASFVEQYANPVDVGPVTSIAFLLGVKDVVQERLGTESIQEGYKGGVSDKQYLSFIAPVTVSMFYYSLLSSGLNSKKDYDAQVEKLKSQAKQLFGAYDGGEEVIKIVNEYILGKIFSAKPLRSWIVKNQTTKTKAWKKFKKGGTVKIASLAKNLKPGADMEYQQYLIDLQEASITSLREQVESLEAEKSDDGAKKKKLKELQAKLDDLEEEEKPFLIKYYSPPGILQRIVNGLYKTHPAVTIQAVGTVVNHDEVYWIPGKKFHEYTDIAKGLKNE